MPETDHLARFLSANPFFAGLGDAPLRALARLGVTRTVAAGATLFQKGDPADALYAVRRGEIRIAARTGDGRELTLNVLGSGEVFGEVALLDGRARTADALASEPTDLFVIRRRDVLDMLAAEPPVALAVIELLCARVRWLSARMEETNFLPLPARLARRLASLADDYGHRIGVTQDELAVFVNASREAVNRQLQAWRRQGVLDLTRGAVHLRDRDALGALAGEGAAG